MGQLGSTPHTITTTRRLQVKSIVPRSARKFLVLTPLAMGIRKVCRKRWEIILKVYMVRVMKDACNECVMFKYNTNAIIVGVIF